jgi:hypothetical protein
MRPKLALKAACLTDRGKTLPEPAKFSTIMAPLAELDATYHLTQVE